MPTPIASAPAAAALEAAAPAPASHSAGDAPAALAAGRCYGFGRGFTWRREAFGGILYHYEGLRPDPRVSFVDNSFLIDLLDALAAHPAVPPAELLDAVQARFALDAPARARLEDFLATLIARGALVPR
jgi:putative mycofactocin binding protein MftB